jgi:hypothetical protein
MCGVHIDLGLPYWRCVLRRCTECPKYQVPNEEKDKSNTASTINFHLYVTTTSCTQHGVLGSGTEIKVCPAHSQVLRDAVGNVKKLGKVSSRKLLSVMCRPIGTFVANYCLPALERYACHQPHVQILGKQHCGKLRKEQFNKTPGMVKTKRDYGAERLLAKFKVEIQSDHFGNGRTLSIEGSSVELYSRLEVETYAAMTASSHAANNKNWENIRMEFHSHFSDKSRQDTAPTTTAHMIILINRLYEDGVFGKNGTMLDDTDGCAKQYRCATAIHLLSMLSVKYGITIDRQVCAPGHGKDSIDGVNTVDKNYTSKCFCMTIMPEANNAANRISAESMVGGSSKSFATECQRICLLDE